MSDEEKPKGSGDKKTDAIMALLAAMSILVTKLRNKGLLSDEELEEMAEGLLLDIGSDSVFGETYKTFVTLIFKRRPPASGMTP